MAFVEDILDDFSKAGLNILIFFDANHSIDQYRKWLGNHKYYPQQGENLGERMKQAFKTAYKQGYTNCILTGSDLPGLAASTIKEGFESLEKSPSCIGPATDGGYYLIGFQKKYFAESIFENMKWSTESVFTKTLSKLCTAGQTPAQLPDFSDIDTKSDLVELSRNKNLNKLCPKTSKMFAKTNLNQSQ